MMDIFNNLRFKTILENRTRSAQYELSFFEKFHLYLNANIQNVNFENFLWADSLLSYRLSNLIHLFEEVRGSSIHLVQNNVLLTIYLLRSNQREKHVSNKSVVVYDVYCGGVIALHCTNPPERHDCTFLVIKIKGKCVHVYVCKRSKAKSITIMVQKLNSVYTSYNHTNECNTPCDRLRCNFAYSERRLTIFVFSTDVPVVNLELGSNINGSAIQEGMDVYFECNIKSNPWVYRVIWRHNGKLLNNNPASGTIVSNQSLVLQKVSRSRAGIYTCVGSNQEVCRPGQETVQGVGRREAAKVLCEVEANPSDNVHYTWRFNNSRETVELDRDRYTEEGPRSTAAYTPLTPLDYGTLMCWASNEFGKQTVPCVYQVIAAGRPDSLENCSVVNQTSASLVVRCQPGFDGGLSQRFVMEVYDRHGQSLAGNVTADQPAFTVGNLPSGLGFDISVYAYNSRGPSDPVQLHAYTLKSAEKRTAVTPTGFRFSPMLAVIAIGCVASVVSVACIVAVAVAVQRKRTRRRRRERSNDESKTAIDGVGGTGTGTAAGAGDGGGVDGGGTGGGIDGGTGGGNSGDRHHQRADTVDDGLEKNPDIIPHDNDYLDEDEKAFERLNSGRIYSSRLVDPETCKQQARGLMPPPPAMTPQQQIYSSDIVGGSPVAGVVYPNLMCPTPPPPPSQLLLHQHYQQQQLQQQQQQPVAALHHLRHNGGGPQHVQYVQVDHQNQFAGHPHQHHHLHHHPLPPPQYQQVPQARTMTLGRYHNNHKHGQDRSAEIPLLLAAQPGLQHHHQLHQRESTTDLTVDQQLQQRGAGVPVFGKPPPSAAPLQQHQQQQQQQQQQQIIAATRF
ncbi:nephrin-like [Aphis craccivora]|uniref:Nephrin-like n=1 Tax=Aphis craccivora TaxID=307492 RepID=A0A6G0YUJ1_APHCR|nr:nephrin-like [Aphis craccivora]